MSKVKTFFCSSSDFEPESDGFGIYLFPTSDGWNDFGTRNIFELKLFSKGELLYSAKEFTKILFIDASIEAEIYKKGKVRVKEVNKEFVSQAAKRESYSELLKHLGLMRTIKFFYLIRDLAVLKSLGREPELRSQENEDVYYKSLTRYSSTYSLVNGCSSLFMLSNQDLLPSIYSSFHLKKFDNEHELNLEFLPNPLLKNRVNILVGKNGVGKSQSLRNICIQQIDRILQEPTDSGEVFNRIFAISNVVEDSFPQISELPEWGGIFYKYINLLEHRGTQSSALSLIDILRQEEDIDELDKFSLLKDSLNGLLDYDDFWLPLKDVSVDFPTVRKDGIKYFPSSHYAKISEKKRLELTAAIDVTKSVEIVVDESFIQLSTGQRFFLNIAIKVISYISTRSLLLFEEPETYLHPNLEVDFYRFISSILDLTDSYGIFSTHSVYLVREVMSTQVQILEKRGSRIEIYKPSIQTFGASLDAISDYIFGDLNKNKVFKDELDKIDVSSEKDIEKVIKYLGDDAVYYLVNKKQD